MHFGILKGAFWWVYLLLLFRWRIRYGFLRLKKRTCEFPLQVRLAVSGMVVPGFLDSLKACSPQTPHSITLTHPFLLNSIDPRRSALTSCLPIPIASTAPGENHMRVFDGDLERGSFQSSFITCPNTDSSSQLQESLLSSKWEHRWKNIRTALDLTELKACRIPANSLHSGRVLGTNAANQISSDVINWSCDLVM